MSAVFARTALRDCPTLFTRVVRFNQHPATTLHHDHLLLYRRIYDNIGRPRPARADRVGLVAGVVGVAWIVTWMVNLAASGPGAVGSVMARA